MHRDTTVIGAGRVGRTVAARLEGSQLVGHGQEPALDGCRRLLVATPDAAIASVCAGLAPRLAPDCAVIHFSGAITVHALDAAPGPKASVHPMQTVDPERGPDQLVGSFAAVSGDTAVGSRLARELGMTPFALADEAKPTYHAASTMASNYLVTLTAVAVSLLERSGLERDQALEVLRPLQERTLEVAGGPPPARSPAAMPRRWRCISPPSGPSSSRSTGCLGAPPYRWFPSVRQTLCEDSCDRRAGADDGGASRGSSGAFARARAEHDRVIMSLFVNPSQFGAGEDFANYPRDPERDREIAAAEGVERCTHHRRAGVSGGLRHDRHGG